MSVNVYLKDEEVRKIEGFEVIKRREKDGSPWEKYKLPGINLSYEKGRWYVTLYEPTDLIPSLVADIVEETTLHEWVRSGPTREAGIYRYESAEAEVEFPSKDGTTWVSIKAEKIKDLHELLRKIRIGSIRPFESYEGEQNGMSRVQLEKKLERSQQERSKLKFSLDELSNQLAGIQNERSKGMLFRMLLRFRNWLVVVREKISQRVG